MTIEQRLEHIEQLLERLVGGIAPTTIKPVSPALQMIQLARQGRIAESKQISKNLMKKRSA